MLARTTIALLALLAALSAPARAVTVKDLTRIRGQGAFELQGVGLVVGLPGTGDAVKNLATARPLAKLLEASGNALGSPQEMLNNKSVALVMVTCTVPETGARHDDAFDVRVRAINGAKSLRGGSLFLAPLRGPTAGSVEPFAIASGELQIEDESVPTAGRVPKGAKMVRETRQLLIEGAFDLIIDSPFAGFAAASEVASAVNAAAQPQGPGVATAIDDRTVRVSIPAWEQKNKAAFIAAVETAEVNPALMGLGAVVIYNAARGSIIMTSDVEISPVAITHKDLHITTTIPAPQPTAQNPVVERKSWVGLSTRSRPSANARLADLLSAFKQLDIPVPEQVAILQQLHEMGSLHARLVVN